MLVASPEDLAALASAGRLTIGAERAAAAGLDDGDEIEPKPIAGVGAGGLDAAIVHLEEAATSK